jgi:hypothetical protein
MTEFLQMLAGHQHPAIEVCNNPYLGDTVKDFSYIHHCHFIALPMPSPIAGLPGKVSVTQPRRADILNLYQHSVIIDSVDFRS